MQLAVQTSVLAKTGNSQFVKTIDGGTQQSIYSEGLKLIDGPSSNPVTGYDLGFASTNSPKLKINAGGSGAAASMQLSSGDQGGAGSRGLFFDAGDSLNSYGYMVAKGQTSNGGDSATRNWLRYTVGEGGSTLSPFTAWNDGSIEFSGSLKFRSKAGSSPFLLTVAATPTANYNIALPPAAPTGNNQTLQVVDSSADPKVLKWGMPSGVSTVGNGTTAAYPPTGPADGDHWYNLEDGRTYTYVNDGNTSQWVDTSPQGSGTLWKQTTAGKIQPANDSDDIRSPKFTGNLTGGTRAVMATANGDLVANVVGPGLEISSGVLQVKRDATANGINLQSVCTLEHNNYGRRLF